MNKIDLVKQEFPKQYRDYAKEIYGLDNGICQHPIYGGRKIHCHSTLYTLIKILRPSTILEIGSWRYDSANIMGRAMADNNITGRIETFEIRQGGYTGGVEKPLFDNVTARFWYPHHTSESHQFTYNNPHLVYPEFQNMSNDEIFEANMKILSKVRPPDGFEFIFIDGDHSWEGVNFDWQYALRMANDETVVCVDDLHDNRLPNVTRFWESLNTYKYAFEDWNANINNDLTLDGVTLIK